MLNIHSFSPYMTVMYEINVNAALLNVKGEYFNLNAPIVYGLSVLQMFCLQLQYLHLPRVIDARGPTSLGFGPDENEYPMME